MLEIKNITSGLDINEFQSVYKISKWKNLVFLVVGPSPYHSRETKISFDKL